MNNFLDNFIKNAIKEDIGDGDHTSLACVPETAVGKLKLLVKQDGIIAGVEIAHLILKSFDENIVFEQKIKDGTPVKVGDIISIEYLEYTNKFKVLKIPTTKSTPKSKQEEYVCLIKQD